MTKIHVRRSALILKPDSSRVLLRAFYPTTEHRSLKIVARVAALSEEQVVVEFEQVLARFENRHRQFKVFLQRRFEQLRTLLLTDAPLSPERQLLLGAYFTQEYALEGAALFNPSLVWHPDQTGLPSGSKRFIVSLRATGEGHISSITFRSGVVDAKNQLTLDAATPYVTAPEVVANTNYEHELFERKLWELDHVDEFTKTVLATLSPQFTLAELKASVKNVEQQSRKRNPNATLSSRCRPGVFLDTFAAVTLVERLL